MRLATATTAQVPDPACVTLKEGDDIIVRGIKSLCRSGHRAGSDHPGGSAKSVNHRQDPGINRVRTFGLPLKEIEFKGTERNGAYLRPWTHGHTGSLGNNNHA
jgi:hypothetical protein